MDEATALDASVIVAALLSWHEHHVPARAALHTLIADRAALILPAPALLEAYAVMTRLPMPHRLAPPDAAELLAGNFRERATLGSLEGAAYWPLLDLLGINAIAGGLTYDAHILACARTAGARRLLTFNRRDFDRLDTTGIAILDPRDG